MSWEPNTEENETRKTRDNLEDLRQAQFFNTSSINSASMTNSMGTSSNMSGFNFDVVGDIVEGITNSVNGGLGELYKILSGYVFITPDASESNNTAVINKIGNGTGNTVDKDNLPQDGQLLTLRPEAGKSLKLINSVKTALSSAGNLLLGSDITLTESESITLRYQNEILFADAISGVSEKIGGWIVHSTGNGSGSSAWVDTATSPLNMDGNAIFFDLKVNNKMSILYNGSNLNYTVDVNAGAHNFYVDDLSLPKFGITETKLESNVPLDMNLNYVEFQEISTPSPTPANDHGFIYAKDVSGVTTPMWSNSAGETSLLSPTGIAWSNVTIDVNKDMNQKQLTNLNAVVSTSNITATGFIFNTSSGNPSKISSSATSDIMGFRVDGVEKGSFAKDGALDTIFEVAGNPSPMMKFSSTATGTNRVVGTIQFDGLDLAPSRQTYGLIYGWSRNVGALSKEGELQFNVMKSNVSTGIMKMDGTGLLPYADNASALGSASLGWSEIRSKGSVYGSQYYFVTSSGTAPRITSSANSTVMGLWVDGFESASVTYDTFGGNKDGEIAINGSSAIGARFKMYNSATPSGGSTTAGRMYFDAIKDGGGGGSETFAMIEAGATNYNSGSEQGEIDFQVRRGGLNTESVAIINQTGFHPPINNSQNYNLGSASTSWYTVYSEISQITKDNNPATLNLYNNKTTAGTATMGTINFQGDVTLSDKLTMGSINGYIGNVSTANNYMDMSFVVRSNNNELTFLELKGGDQVVKIHKPADLVRQAVPTDPASNATGKLFYNSVDNHLSFRKRNDADSAFETVDLEGGGGGSQTPWTSTINADNNPLIGANYIQFNNINQAVNPADTVPFIQFDNYDMTFNIPTGKGYEVNINGDTLIGISGTLVNITSLGSMVLKSNTSNTIQMFAGSNTVTHTFQDNALTLGAGIDLVVSGNLIDFTNRATPSSIFGNGAMYSKGGDPMWWDGTTETSMLGGGGSSGGGVNNSWIWKDDETNEFDEAVYLSNAVMGRDTQTTNAVLPYKDTVYWVPMYFSKACTINAIGLQFIVAGSGSMGLMYGLYDTYADQNYPKSLIDGGSSVGYMGTGLGGNFTLTTSFAVPSAGLYFIAIKNDTNTGSAFRVQGGGSTSPTPSLGHYYVSGTSNGFMPITGYFSTEYGNLPSTAQIDDDMSVTYYGGTNTPLIFVRVS